MGNSKVPRSEINSQSPVAVVVAVVVVVVVVVIMSFFLCVCVCVKGLVSTLAVVIRKDYDL